MSDSAAPEDNLGRIFVGNLAWETTDKSLEDLFATYGAVKEARVAVDRNSGRSRGFGFVTFVEQSAAEEAVRGITGTSLHGREIRVELAGKERKPREPRGDRGGFRGGDDRRGGGGGGRRFDDRRGGSGGRDFERRDDRRGDDRRGDDRRGGGRDFGRGREDRFDDRRGGRDYDRRDDRDRSRDR